MLFDPNHLKDNNETYVSHFVFASKIGLHLLIRSIVFLVHAVIPLIVIPKKMNLSSTCELITHWNAHSKSRVDKKTVK